MKKVYFLLILTLVFASCRKKKTIWDADYVVPLINDTLSFANYVNDSTLGIDNAGFYNLNLKRELLSFDLNSEVTIPDTTIFSSFTSAVSFNIPPGFSFVNDAQEKSFSLSNLELNKVIFSKGQIAVKVYNPYPTSVICDVLLPTTTKNGMNITDQMVVGPGSIANPAVGEKTIDIAYSHMDLTGLAGNTFNKLTYKISVKTDPNGNSVATNATYVTNVETKIQNLEIFYAKGYFGNRIIADTVDTNIEALKKWGSGDIDIQNVNLNLKMSNSIKTMGRITIKELRTTKADGTVTVLTSPQINVPQNVNPATGAWQTLTASELNFPFTSSNSNIDDFIENAGSKVRVVYEFELNPLGNITSSSNEVFPNSEVKLDLELNMPLEIGLNGLTLRDTMDLNLTKNSKEINRAQSAEIVAEVENGFPISGKILLKVLDADNNELITIANDDLILSSLYGTVNIQGILTKPTTLNWHFSKSDLEKLAKGKKIVVQSVFDTPTPSSSSNILVQFEEGTFLATKIKLLLTYQNEL